MQIGGNSGGDPRRFFAVIAIGLLAIVTLGAVVIAVDPYLYYGAPRIDGFNRWKTRFFPGQYDSKARLILHSRPRHLILGTSTAGGSLRPDHPVFGGEPAFNYALAGSTPRLQGMALAQAMERGTLRSVIVCIDLFPYNAFMDQRAFRQFELAVEQGGGTGARWRRSRRVLETWFSEALRYDSVMDAVATMKEQRLPGADGIFRDIREDGYWQNPRPEGLEKLRLFITVEREYLGDGWFPEPERRFAFDDGRGRSTMSELRTILSRSLGGGLEVFVAIMPSHARLAEAMHEAGLWDEFDLLKRGVAGLADEVDLGGGAIRVWDFSGYHSVSMDPVKGAAADTRWFEDSIHPTEAAGDLMLQRMLGDAGSRASVPADFGRELEKRTLDAQLAAAVARRAEYIDTRREDVTQVRLIARKTGHRREASTGRPAD